LDPAREEMQHELPVFLPDGNHFVFFAVSRRDSESGEFIAALSDPPGSKPKKLLPLALGATPVTGRPGEPLRLLYLAGDAVMAQEFDTGRLELRGKPLALPVRAGAIYQTPYLAATPSILVYRNAGSENLWQLSMFDIASGQQLNDVGPAQRYTEF